VSFYHLLALNPSHIYPIDVCFACQTSEPTSLTPIFSDNFANPSIAF